MFKFFNQIFKCAKDENSDFLYKNKTYSIDHELRKKIKMIHFLTPFLPVIALGCTFLLRNQYHFDFLSLILCFLAILLIVFYFFYLGLNFYLKKYLHKPFD